MGKEETILFICVKTEDVNSASVTWASEPFGVDIKSEREDLGIFRASSEFSQQSSCFSIKDSNDSSLWNQFSLSNKRETTFSEAVATFFPVWSSSRLPIWDWWALNVMRFLASNYFWVMNVRGKSLPYVWMATCPTSLARQARTVVWGSLFKENKPNGDENHYKKRAETSGIFCGLNAVDELDVRKIVDVNFVFDDDDNFVCLESDGLDISSEAEFGYTFRLMIIPKHDFVEGVLGRVTTADKSQYIASVEHFYDSDSATQVLRFLEKKDALMLYL